MMSASNRGVGMAVGFPDVKLTPPLGVPVPYPNLAPDSMAAVFSPNIFVGYMPQLQMASVKPMTLGNQAGVMHPLFMQMGGYTMGNPRVLINCLPAVGLCTPTWGNLFNNPIGLVAVPSITTTRYSDREAAPGPASGLAAEEQRALVAAVKGDAGAVTGEQLASGVGLIAITRFTTDAPTRFFVALERLDASAGLVIDLRGCPGGDLDAALEIAGELVPRGTPLAIVDEGFGPRVLESRHEPSYAGPVLVVVDALTASAAEVVAAAWQCAGRARVAGEPTYGKGSAQSARRADHGALEYASVASVRAPDGRAIQNQGVLPDHVTDPANLEELLSHLLPLSTTVERGPGGEA